jgi:DNA-binding response OmpR family regulator
MPPTILIVDDDPSLSAPLKDGLESRGYQVAVACDGLQAIQQACEAKPDLIILDFHMPGGGGTAAYTAMRELAPTRETPVVFLTAVPVEEVKHSVCFGADTYFIAKPAGLDKLVPLIRRALAEDLPS